MKSVLLLRVTLDEIICVSPWCYRKIWFQCLYHKGTGCALVKLSRNLFDRFDRFVMAAQSFAAQQIKLGPVVPTDDKRYVSTIMSLDQDIFRNVEKMAETANQGDKAARDHDVLSVITSDFAIRDELNFAIAHESTDVEAAGGYIPLIKLLKVLVRKGTPDEKIKSLKRSRMRMHKDNSKSWQGYCIMKAKRWCIQIGNVPIIAQSLSEVMFDDNPLLADKWRTIPCAQNRIAAAAYMGLSQLTEALLCRQVIQVLHWENFLQDMRSHGLTRVQRIHLLSTLVSQWNKADFGCLAGYVQGEPECESCTRVLGKPFCKAHMKQVNNLRLFDCVRMMISIAFL